MFRRRPVHRAAVVAILAVGILAAPASTSFAQGARVHFITTGLNCSGGVCSLAGGSVGQSYGQNLATAGGSCGGPCVSLPTFTVVRGSLPAGLAMPITYGCCGDAIGGTPTAAGTSTFTVQVRDGAGDTARQAFRIAVSPAAPLRISFSATCCAPGTVGASYLQNFFLSGGIGPFSAAVSAGSLPPGLHLASTPPISITGTPTARGTFSFTLTVTDSNGGQASTTGSIAVN